MIILLFYISKHIFVQRRVTDSAATEMKTKHESGGKNFK